MIKQRFIYFLEGLKTELKNQAKRESDFIELIYI